MKRRSARPFTVEVKHTRIFHASLTDATARTHKGPELWRSISLAPSDESVEVKPVQPAPTVRAEPVRAEAPARRVLPSLVPTFSMPAEPEVPTVRERPAPERLPHVRRVTPPAEPVQKSAATAGIKRGPRAEPAIQTRVTPAAIPAAIAAPVMAAQPAVAHARTGRRGQPAETLRAGERWKRRLPRVLW